MSGHLSTHLGWDRMAYLSPALNARLFFNGVGLSPLGTVATSGLLYKPQMIDEGDCGAVGGMKIGRGNQSTQRKPAPMPLCPPQIPHDQTRAAAVGVLGLLLVMSRFKAWLIKAALGTDMWNYWIISFSSLIKTAKIFECWQSSPLQYGGIIQKK
jgi:hypothetical protein